MLVSSFAGALSAFYIFFRFPTFLKITPYVFIGLIFVFFALAPLSLLSVDYYLEFSYFFNILQYLLLGSSIGIYLSLNKKNDIKFFLFLCLLANFSGVIFSLLGFIELSYLRVTGFFNNANFMAIHLGLFGLLALASFNNIYVKLLIIFFTTLLLFFTFSRAGMICWIVSLAVYLITSAKDFRVILAILILSILLIPSFLILISNADYLQQEVLNDRLNISFSNYSFAERVFLVEKSLEYMQNFKILGYGPGYTFSPNWGFSVSTHNIYVLTFIEYGIIGFTIFSLILLNTFIKIIKSNEDANTKSALISAFIYILLQGFFSHNFFDAIFFFFFIFFSNYLCSKTATD